MEKKAFQSENENEKIAEHWDVTALPTSIRPHSTLSLPKKSGGHIGQGTSGLPVSVRKAQNYTINCDNLWRKKTTSC